MVRGLFVLTVVVTFWCRQPGVPMPVLPVFYTGVFPVALPITVFKEILSETAKLTYNQIDQPKPQALVAIIGPKGVTVSPINRRVRIDLHFCPAALQYCQGEPVVQIPLASCSKSEEVSKVSNPN